jgi:GTP-binding protein
MIIKSTQFIGSFNLMEQCPNTEIPEFAFIGRSNVGKSSLINFLTQKGDLAKVSNTPGKTQSMNFFLINNTWHLIDLPGYGYAQRSRKLREEWVLMQKKFLDQREQIQCVFQLIDGRIPPQKSDLEQTNWLGESGIPVVLIFTKMDKKEYAANQVNVAAYKKKLSETWEDLPTNFLISSLEKKGREEIMEFISGVIEGAK